MQVLQMEDKNRKKEITRAILEALPEWFGIERAREEYIKFERGKFILGSI